MHQECCKTINGSSASLSRFEQMLDQLPMSCARAADVKRAPRGGKNKRTKVLTGPSGTMGYCPCGSRVSPVGGRTHQADGKETLGLKQTINNTINSKAGITRRLFTVGSFDGREVV